MPSHEGTLGQPGKYDRTCASSFGQPESTIQTANRSFSHFWATVCKTVRPMLSVRCLSVLSVYVTLVYCGQTLGWINTKLGMEVGFGPGHIVLDGDPAARSPNGHSPQFSAHVCCVQTASWIKIPLGMDVGLSPSDIVLDRDPSPPSPKRGEGSSPLPLYGPCIVAKWVDVSRCHLVHR